MGPNGATVAWPSTGVGQPEEDAKVKTSSQEVFGLAMKTAFPR